MNILGYFNQWVNPVAMGLNGSECLGSCACAEGCQAAAVVAGATRGGGCRGNGRYPPSCVGKEKAVLAQQHGGQCAAIMLGNQQWRAPVLQEQGREQAGNSLFKLHCAFVHCARSFWLKWSFV